MRPSTFYKYLPPARVDVLQDLRIRYTQISALNDPFESPRGTPQNRPMRVTSKPANESEAGQSLLYLAEGGFGNDF